MGAMMNSISEEFPRQLRSWRAKCGVSQLELSLRCEVSQKHISFLELARTSPSKTMVMLICEALNLPLRDRNTLLLAAGFAPAYKERQLSEPELTAVNQAVTMMLDQQEPYPAFVVGRVFNIIRANQGAMKLAAILFDVSRPEDMPPMEGALIRGLFHPDGFRRYIKNWHEVASYVLRQLQSEVFASGSEPELRDLLNELESYEGVPEDWKRLIPSERLAPVVTLDIEKDGLELSFFTTIATLGTPLDVALQETRIESYFPADDATRQFFMDS